MRILCIADQIDPLVYSNSIKTRFKDIDLVLSAGDLPMEYLEFISSTLNKPVVFVFGNHHLNSLKVFRRDRTPMTQEELQNSSCLFNSYGSTYVGGKVLKIKDVIIAGLGGSMWYNGGLNQFNDRQMLWKVLKLVPRLLFNKIFFGRYLDIFLTHSPPFGIGDKPDRCHTGFKSFLWFMRIFKPEYLVHGHIHLYDLNAMRKTRYQSTTIMNVYNHYVFDFNMKAENE